MKLEVIDKGSTSAAHPAPLLFIHGSWHAAWCWDEHFLDFFADAGYRAVAVSLRNHGQSERAGARRCSVADWVQDVVSVARCLPVEPVVIGHSMGGFIVQKYLETYSAPAGVLLATMPVSGASRALIRILGRHPTRSAGTPDPDLARYTALLDEEYVGRQAVDLTLLSLPKPKRVTTPLLVLGAAEDACFSPKEIRKTACAYGTDADFFIGMGHNMMLEPDWRAVAERIDGWLSTQGL